MATTEQQDKLRQYLLEQQARRAAMESPEYRKSVNEDAMADYDSTSRNNLAALLMKSAAQAGSIGGKVADASPVDAFSKQQNANTASFRNDMNAQNEQSEKRYGVDAKVYEYLADKEAKKNQDDATADYQSKSLKQSGDLAAQRLASDSKYKDASLDLQRQKIEAEAANAANKSDHKKLVASDVAQGIGKYDSAIKLIEDLEKDWGAKASGRLSGVTQYVPGTDASKYTDATNLTAQNVGQILEGGKLTDSDYARYQSMMPTAGDSAARAENKFRLLKQQILEKKRGSIAGAGDAGYEVSGFGAVPDKAKPVDLSGKPTGAIAAPAQNTVNIKAPNGEIRPVPESSVQKYIDKGGVVVP